VHHQAVTQAQRLALLDRHRGGGDDAGVEHELSEIDNKELCEMFARRLGADVPVEKLENVLLDVYVKNSKIFQNVINICRWMSM